MLQLLCKSYSVIIKLYRKKVDIQRIDNVLPLFVIDVRFHVIRTKRRGDKIIQVIFKHRLYMYGLLNMFQCMKLLIVRPIGPALVRY